ncbi:hypothetical protein D3C86_2180130 [compost metagenome]
MLSQAIDQLGNVPSAPAHACAIGTGRDRLKDLFAERAADFRHGIPRVTARLFNGAPSVGIFL